MQPARRLSVCDSAAILNSERSKSPVKVVDSVAPYMQRLEKMNGINGRLSPIIQRDFQHPSATNRNLANLALLERLESVTADSLVAELRAGTNPYAKYKPVRTQTVSRKKKSVDDGRRSSSDPLSDAGSTHPRKSAPASPVEASASAVPVLGFASSFSAGGKRRRSSILMQKGAHSIQMAAQKLPVRVAGLTIGSFKNVADRMSYIVNVSDKTLAGEFVHAFFGTPIVLSSEIAVGSRPTAALRDRFKSAEAMVKDQAPAAAAELAGTLIKEAVAARQARLDQAKAAAASAAAAAAEQGPKTPGSELWDSACVTMADVEAALKGLRRRA